MDSNQKNTQIILKRIPEYGTYIFLVILVLDVFVTQFLQKTWFEDLFKLLNINFQTDYRITIGVLLLISFATNLTIQYSKLKQLILSLSNKYHGVIEVLKTNNVDFTELLKNNHVINILTLSGSITGDLGNDEVIQLLKNRNRNSKITILIANPFSEAIITRYKNDEPKGYVAGVDGIKRRLVMLHEIKTGLPKNHNSKLSVKVYNNYPTISIFQADNDVYSSVYGYKLRGNDCPTIHAEKGKGYGVFLLNHFNKVNTDSVSIFDWFNKFENELTDL